MWKENVSAHPSNKEKKNQASIEEIYQKKTQVEHILLRPDTYIGSVEPDTRPMWILDEESKRMFEKEVSFVPGLYKIFDEILVNAADNKQRDASMDCIKVEIDRELNQISIWNNGKGIPVQIHKEHQVYVPELIFGQLLTSSNYDVNETSDICPNRNRIPKRKSLEEEMVLELNSRISSQRNSLLRHQIPLLEKDLSRCLQII